MPPRVSESSASVLVKVPRVSISSISVLVVSMRCSDAGPLLFKLRSSPRYPESFTQISLYHWLPHVCQVFLHLLVNYCRLRFRCLGALWSWSHGTLWSRTIVKWCEHDTLLNPCFSLGFCIALFRVTLVLSHMLYGFFLGLLKGRSSLVLKVTW